MNPHTHEINPGPLWHLSREEAFARGTEWGQVLARIEDSAAPFVMTIHSENVDRIDELLKDSGRKHSFSEPDGDWVTLTVEGLE